MFSRPNPQKNELVLHSLSLPTIFLRQLKNPLLIILVLATAISFFLGERTSALVIFGMILLSVLMGFWNEYSAEKTVADLLKKVSLMATIIKDSVKQEIPVRDLVQGDTVLLTTGSVVPADLKLENCKNLEINEAILTGESLPILKTDENNLAFMGTIVVSGSAQGQVIAIGNNTKFGHIAADLSQVRPETEFQKGLKSFGFLLVRIISLMTIVIFAVNSLLGRSLLESILFALAIAIGLTPELLPVVVTVSLSHGARALAKKDVIVKQLVAIEDLGNMEVLCTDKTGTLTEGKISLVSLLTPRQLTTSGDPPETGQMTSDQSHLLDLALECNSAVVHHRVFGDAIDSAIWQFARTAGYRQPKPESKVDQEPFDYNHRAMFTVIQRESHRVYILKGAPEEILQATSLEKSQKDKLTKKFENFSSDGFRVIAVAEKKIADRNEYSFADAKDLEFSGFITFSDVPKKSAKDAFLHLKKLGVQVKIVTGDNELVTRQVCTVVGIDCNNLLLGSDIEKMSDAKLQEAAWKTDAFVRVSPEQKLRIVQALKFKDHPVGYLGDGINDAPALHAADVAISVNSAVDVAKDTATVVLLHKSLSVIAEGVTQGRKIFNNTIKYILIGTSSNFGNMFSAASSSFFLPFLPMTPAQILLTNSLYDISQLSIPTDNVDPEVLLRPRKWDIKFIKRYMLYFGPISSLYDFATFGVMLFVFGAKGSLFQTGWFIESLLTEVLVVFVIRTTRVPFFKSLPSRALFLTCIGVVIAGVLIPFIAPLAQLFNFTSPPPLYFVFLIGMTVTYLFLVEIGKTHLNKTLAS